MISIVVIVVALAEDTRRTHLIVHNESLNLSLELD